MWLCAGQGGCVSSKSIVVCIEEPGKRIDGIVVDLIVAIVINIIANFCYARRTIAGAVVAIIGVGYIGVRWSAAK